MNYIFDTKNGNRYMIVPFESNICTLMKKGERDYETVGRIYAPNEDDMRAGKPITLTFTCDMKIRTSTIMHLAQTEDVMDDTGHMRPEIVPSKTFGRSYHIHTRSGSNYTIADTKYPGISKITRWDNGKEFEVFTPDYDELTCGKPLSLTLTNGENVLRTSNVMEIKQIGEPYKDLRMTTANKGRTNVSDDIAKNVPEWLADGYEIHTKNTNYRLVNTKDSNVKLIYGGEFTGQEVVLSNPIAAGEKLSMTLTGAPQNGRLAGRMVKTSEIQSVRPAVVTVNEGKSLTLDSFGDAVDHLNFVNNMQTTM